MKNYDKPGMKAWRVIYPSLLYLGINILVSSIFTTWAMMYVIVSKDTTDPSLILDECMQLALQYNYELIILIAIAALPVMLFFMRHDRKREVSLGIYLRYDRVNPVYYLATALLGIGACLTINHLLNISGLTELYTESLEDMGAVLYQGNLMLEIIGVGIIVPITEEMIFRGLTMRRLREYQGSGMAIFLSSLLFACYHGNIIQGIYAFVLGLLLGYVYDKYRNILAPIVLHASANVISVLVSETTILLPVYENEVLYMVVTVLAALLTLAAIGIIQYKVEPECLTKLPEDRPDDIETPDHEQIP